MHQCKFATQLEYMHSGHISATHHALSISIYCPSVHLSFGHHEVVQHLMERGAKKERRSDSGRTIMPLGKDSSIVSPLRSNDLTSILR